MGRSNDDNRINIRPEVSILSVLRHLNYKPWFALAEFVDNSLQSFNSNRKALQAIHGMAHPLTVSITLDTEPPGRITIRDNAAGIAEKDYARAFKPAEVPPDRSGLSEFGMGMKSAACWLAANWSVRTSALGEPVERRIEFDVSDIVENRVENLDVSVSRTREQDHFTELVLDNLHKIPQGRTVGKIKEHLADIYRVFIRDGSLALTFNGEPLTYNVPSILHAPYYRSPNGQALLWRKEIDFDFGDGLRAWGFAALREKGSVSSAGFALFRRNRLIQGSGDEGYRPASIFGQSNSYRYQRLFGELHLEGFEVSHTKDGFRWEEHEDVFLEFLSEHLDEKPVCLLDQAEGHRSRPSRNVVAQKAKAAVERTATVIHDNAPEVIEDEIDSGPAEGPPPEELPVPAEMTSERTIDLELKARPWRILIEITNDPAIGDWVSLSDSHPSSDNDRRVLAVRLSMAHPFSERFIGASGENVESLLRMAAAIGLAEITARESGVKQAGTFRRTINELLRDALSRP